MDVQARAAVRPLGHVADQRQDLTLLLDRDGDVLLLAPVQPAERGPLEAAYAGDLRRLEVLGAREVREDGDRLVVRIAHHHVRDSVRVRDYLGFHCLTPHEGAPPITARSGRPTRQYSPGPAAAVPPNLTDHAWPADHPPCGRGDRPRTTHCRGARTRR